MLRRILHAMNCVVALAVLVAVAACDSTSPPKPVAIVFMGDANQSGTVGQVLIPGPQIEIRDDKGNPLSGIALTVTVAGGGTLSGTPAKTTSNSTALGTWTLGTTAGTQSLTVASSGLPSLTISAVATPGPATTSSTGGAPAVSEGTAGAVSVSQPQIKIFDAFGNAVPGLPIVVQVIGGGSVQNPNPVTNNAGIASVGAWTLGTTAGQQRVTLSAGGLVPPVVFTATASAGPPGAIIAVGATSASGMVGQTASIAPSVKLTDAFGNAIAGVAVTAAVGPQSGTVVSPSSTTNLLGVASAGSWTLGAIAGTQTVTMSVPGLAPVVFTVAATEPAYTIDVRYVGAAPSDAMRAAVAAAVNRLQRIVTSPLPTQSFSGDAGGCQPGAGTITVSTNGIVVLVSVQTNDGPGGILAFAGPCAPFRQSVPPLPWIAALVVDSADATHPLMSFVILHELIHALGFGTLWEPVLTWTQTLLAGKFTTNPYFTGPQAIAAYLAAQGTQAIGVPVENCVGISGCGPGTIYVHWRESVFRSELMTGYIDANPPLSAISIRSLQDLGYTVDVTQADPFTVAPPGQVRAGIQELGIHLREPPWTPRTLVDSNGHVVKLPPPVAVPFRRPPSARR